jgi:hypothetical protein
MPQNPEHYFLPDYATARAQFREAAIAAGARLEILALAAKGPADESLSIDTAHFGAENPRRVLLHSSGLHGIEAFSGSAIQLQLLADLPALPDDTALIIAHVLNPYGMAWLRRVNENNVDLNRNFLGDEAYSGAPAAYRQIDWFLNPPSPPSADFFLPRAMWLIARYGFASLKQAIGEGQYEYSRGLMFGGKSIEEGPAKLQAFLARKISTAQAVFAIDIHTGLGKFGEDTLLTSPQGYEEARKLFGNRVSPADAETGLAYRTRGSLDTMLARLLPRATAYLICQEFGTRGPLAIVKALRQENRWHNYGGGAIDHPTKQRLRDAFSPDSDAWRRAVLLRGKELLDHGLRIVTQA